MAAGEITGALSLLFESRQVIEVRAITEEGMASGYFDDPEALAEAIAPLDASGTAGIYVTLNEVNPALLSRRANRIKMRLSKKDSTTAGPIPSSASTVTSGQCRPRDTGR